MKKLIFLLVILFFPVILFSQVVITADSNYIKLERTGNTTVVMFTKDIKFGYITNTFYFADKLSSGGWDYTVRYADIFSYNSVAKVSESFPSFTTMRDALIGFIKTGKKVASTTSPTGGSTSANQLKQITRGVNDSTMQAALKVTQDSIKLKLNQQMGKNGYYIVTGTTGTTYSSVWCLLTVEATVLDTLIISGTTMKTVTLAAGQILYGNITRVKPTSGKFILYK